MISFQNITKIYPPDARALEDVTFSVKPKEFVCVVGKSGAGKTTLLKLLLAEESPTSGKIFFDNQEIEKIERKDLPYLRRKIGAVFQDYKLLSQKTTYENIAYAMEVIGASDAETERDVVEVLEIVGLKNKANNFPAQLSGGEKQRAAIARALIHRPEVILADEPTGNLDPYHTLDIIRLLLKINELGTTVLLATHDASIVNRIGKRVISMDKGRIVRDQKSGKYVI